MNRTDSVNIGGAAQENSNTDTAYNSEDLFIKARDKAFRFLSYRARSAKEITDKLLQEQFSPEIIARVMELLLRYNYIDDLSFAQDYIESRIKSRGYGELRIRHELHQKGIDKDIINQVFASLDYNAVERAVSLLHKKLRGETDADYAEKNRAHGFLARKGYSNDVIYSAFKQYFS